MAETNEKKETSAKAQSEFAAQADPKPDELKAETPSESPPPPKPGGMFSKLHLIDIYSELVELFKGIASYDGPTQRMSFLFILSLVGLLSVSGITFHRYWIFRKSEILRIAEDEGAKKQAALLKELEKVQLRESTVNLGVYTVELRLQPNLEKQRREIVNLAQVEVVLLCDTGETGNYVRSHLEQTKSELTMMFLSMERDDLMTRLGKRKLKGKILRRLNGWLPNGKVEEVYFSKLIIS